MKYKTKILAALCLFAVTNLFAQQIFASGDVSKVYRQDMQLTVKGLALWQTKVSENEPGYGATSDDTIRTVSVVSALIDILENLPAGNDKSELSVIADTAYVLDINELKFYGRKYIIFFEHDNLACSTNFEVFEKYVENNSFFFMSYSTVQSWFGEGQRQSIGNGTTISMSVKCIDESANFKAGLNRDYIFKDDEFFAEAQ